MTPSTPTSEASVSGQTKPLLIATEEAFATWEYIETYLWLAGRSEAVGLRYPAIMLSRPDIQERLTNIDLRLADMDEHGVDVHLLSLTSPGVQVFDADLGAAIARRTNDALAALIQLHPQRLCGLAAIAPQDPEGAAAEIERAIGDLGLNGIIINSHTHGEFLDDPKFWPIFDAAVRHRAPIYLHPTFPPDNMVKPYERYGMAGAIWGFGAETSLHAVRMVLGGVFDHYPDLQIVLGHMGEALSFWFLRLDLMHKKLMAHRNLPPNMVKLKRLPSEYIRSNFHFTTSGMYWDDLLEFTLKAMGIERILFSIDYPFETSKPSVDFIRQIPMSDNNKKLIMADNAIKLFGIRR